MVGNPDYIGPLVWNSWRSMEKMEADCVSNEYSSSSDTNTVDEEEDSDDQDYIEKIKEFHLAVGATDQPAKTATAGPSSSSFQTRAEKDTEISVLLKATTEKPTGTVKELTTRDLISPALRNKFPGLANFGTGIQSTYEWTDNNLKVKNHIDVNAFQSQPVETRRQILEAALSSLTDNVSTMSVGYILMGAFGLRSCIDVTKYCLTYPKMDAQPTSVQTLEARAVYFASEPSRVKYPEDVDWSHWERSACYLCAALLRLVTKDHENIQRAWKNIGRQYKNFYEESIMFDIEIDPKCALGIRNVLQTKTIVKNTIGVFLLAFTQLKGQDMSLCSMLFEQHMSYTGMHACNLILYCASKLSVPLNIFSDLIRNPCCTADLRMAMTILTTYAEPMDDKTAKIAENAKTWKFARIFDSKVFAVIQTKRCPMLVCALAHMAKKLGMGGTGDVTKIRQIADLAEQQREIMERVADQAIKTASELAGKKPENVGGRKKIRG